MQVLIPDLGDFSDVEVIEVLVGPGDEVAPEDALITLETEKGGDGRPVPGRRQGPGTQGQGRRSGERRGTRFCC